MPRQIVLLAIAVVLFASGCGNTPAEDTSPLYVAEPLEPIETADVVVRFEDNCVYAYDDADTDGERALIVFAPGVAEREESSRLTLIGEGGALNDASSKTLDFHSIKVQGSWEDAIQSAEWRTTAPTSCSATEIWIVTSGDLCCPESG